MGSRMLHATVSSSDPEPVKTAVPEGLSAHGLAPSEDVNGAALIVAEAVPESEVVLEGPEYSFST